MKRFQVAAGTMAGSWATARTGKTIPILLAAQASGAASQVNFEDGFAPVAKRAVPDVVNQDIVKAFHLSETYGALLGDVTKDSPAAKSGLKTGDIILDVDGQKIEDGRALQLKIGDISPDTTVKLTVFRNGATQEIPVKLGEMPGGAAQSAGASKTQGAGLRGISVGALTPDVFSRLKLPASTKGVVVTNIDPASAASEAGILQGDVIAEVNHQPVTGVAGFDRAMQSAGNQPVLLLINRNGVTSFVVVQAQ